MFGLVPAVASAAPSYRVVDVYSPAMKKNVKVAVVSAGYANAPTVYMLDGLRGTVTDNGWLRNTDVVGFFKTRRVNAVIPLGGGGTFYSDWERRDPKFGIVKWETFLSRELPAYMTSKFGASPNRNAIVGLSMSGTAALNIAAHHSDKYKAVASLSGYPETRGPVVTAGIMASVAEMGGDPMNMWGAPWSPKWAWNNPAQNVSSLRGKGVFVSAGTGIPTLDDARDMLNDPARIPVWAVQGAPLETVAAASSAVFLPAAAVQGVYPVRDFPVANYHNWRNWNHQYKQAWYTTIKPALF